jgi:hypothetical protein
VLKDRRAMLVRSVLKAPSERRARRVLLVTMALKVLPDLLGLRDRRARLVRRVRSA